MKNYIYVSWDEVCIIYITLHRKRKVKKKAAPRKNRVRKKIEEIEEEKDGSQSASRSGAGSSSSGSDTVSSDGMVKRRTNGHHPPRGSQPPALQPFRQRRGFFATRC